MDGERLPFAIPHRSTALLAVDLTHLAGAAIVSRGQGAPGMSGALEGYQHE